MNAKIENQRMLASLVGINEDEAAKRLEVAVKITYSSPAQPLGDELREQLERTVQIAGSGGRVDLEVVLDCSPAEGKYPRIFVGGTPDYLLVSRSPVQFEPNTLPNLPGLIRSIAACYVCSVALRLVLGASQLAKDYDPFKVEYANLGLDRALLEQPIRLSETVLAGAGAIGNGFLRALRHFRVEGTLWVADPKIVGEGNLNRCLYYEPNDIRKLKAPTLCSKAQPDFPALKLEPFEGTSTDLVKKEGRIRRVIVAVDSRKTRRSIQSDLHLEVVDSSTTEAKEIIIHSHRQPTENACLGCIYKHIPDEQARAKDIAAGLGIDLADVADDRISLAVAERIVRSHPQLDVNTITGMAYDSLFKNLCGEQALLTPTGAQILAPFAFVTNLAGAFLALELARSLHGRAGDSNYMSISPWYPPHPKLRRIRSRDAECEYCDKPEFAGALKLVWPETFH
jgi:molybdopterin/thiamine biosynthesis adenylyltransferase